MSIQFMTGTVPVLTLAQRLRIARENAGMEQEDMARAMEISRGSISAYERAVTAPKGLVLRAWALATGVDEQWLRTGEATPPTPPDGLQTGYKSGRTGHLASMEDYVTAA